jgi:hypothetical protein
VIGDLARRIERRRRDHVALIIMAQLAGHVDGVADLDGLGIAVLLFPRHTQVRDFLFDVAGLGRRWGSREGGHRDPGSSHGEGITA